MVLKRTLKRIGLTLLLILFIFGIAAIIYYFGDSYKEFYKLSNKEFAIPGLDTSFTPQGIDYDKNSKQFLISGYMGKDEASRLYLVKTDEDNKQINKYFTLKFNDEIYKGHCGGVAINGDYAWIVGEKMLYRFNFNDALNCKNGQSINIIDKVEIGNGADFILVRNNNLIVGEFYKKDKYDTDASHHIKISENETNYALALIFEIDQSKMYGLKSTTPIAGISLPNQVQGMTFTKDDNIVLSTSYSIPASHLLIHKNVLKNGPTKQINFNNSTLPIYVISNETLIKDIKTCPMSEEIVLVDNRVYVLFESACKKYKLINREVLSNVYSVNI